MLTSNPSSMAQTAVLRARSERGSVCWQMLVAGYTVYGRPGYWRMVDNSIPVGEKAGGFVKSANVKTTLTALYNGDVSFADGRTALTVALKAEDFLKETVR